MLDIQKLLAEMTVEEKCSLLQGKNDWYTVPVERLGIPSVMVSDGPHGLRKQDDSKENPGMNEAITAVCFPAGAGTACSFDRSLLEELGGLLADECQAEHVGVLLGPAANIKRSPLCGRNFEYYSEDPVLSGEIAAAWIRGLQRKGVGCSLKHFAANNQETLRMCVNETIPERPLREIYLANFERAVTRGKPWTMMCSYNKINGTYSSENSWLLTDVLRKEWGFDGLVMTDWGACNDHVAGIKSGLELEMPRAGDDDDAIAAQAVRDGRISMEELDRAAGRVLQLVDRVLEGRKEGMVFDREAHHRKSREMAREAMVLLKNDNELLPLARGGKVAFIGAFAENPRYQGGGSSHITSSRELCALEAGADYAEIIYARGFDLTAAEPDAGLIAEAVQAAREADSAVLFLGLPDERESEGYDRTTLALPENQNALVEAVLAAQPNTAVVLHNGAPVVLPWADRVPAILEAYLGGQACGGAVADLLFGEANPCAKLAETFPLRLEDTPCYLDFPGDGGKATYSEGIWVGYRYYDKRSMPVCFPFGHGLSYTTFEYSNLTLSTDTLEKGEITVSVDVTNTGKRAGKEIVQFYVHPLAPQVSRPVRELKEFAKVALESGETKTVTVTLTPRDFAYWETGIHGWYAEPGEYLVEAAASSRDIRLEKKLTVVNRPLPVPVSGDMPYGEAMKIPGAEKILDSFLKDAQSIAGLASDQLGESGKAMMEAMLRELPLHSCCSFTPVTRETVAKAVEALQKLPQA